MSADDAITRATDGLSESKRRLLEQRLRRKPAAGRAVAESIPARTATGPRRASAGERWIFFAHQSSRESSSSNITSSFLVSGPLDLALLERSVNRVVARHDILRSNFRLTQSNVEVIVHDELMIRIDRIQCAPGDLEKTAEALVRVPFDLGGEPLLRLHYLEAPEDGGLLTLVIHDIVFDKWSLGIFWRETAAFYREVRNGEAAALPRPAIQYADFAEWQREFLAAGRLDRQLDYWKTQLARLGEPITLPTDRPLSAQSTDEGRLERYRVDADVTKQLKRIAAGENASLFMLLLAAFQIQLHRYTGATDIVVGSPVANRRRKETADLIGFFLSTVALRTKLENDPSALDTLRHVRQTVLEALEHQDVSFDRVVEAVKPRRVQGRHPVFQVMFVYQRQNEAAPEFDLGDVGLRHTYVETRTAKFDLTLFAAESGNEIETILEYRTDLFERETMQRMLRHYSQLLESIAAAPDRPISELTLLTSDERSSLMRQSQGETLAIEDRPETIAEISDRSDGLPDAPAVVGAGRTLTYGQLARLSDSIAGQLVRVGAGDGQPVAHFMGRTPESIAAVIGILKAGAAYVPIDPDYPETRRQFIVRDARIETAVTSSGLRAGIAGLVENLVLADGPLPATHDAAPLPEVALRRPAYVIYTSGSTGEPKGVVVTHRNLLYSTRARVRYYSERPERYLLLPSFSFDSSVAGIFWTLVAGGTLVIAGVEELRDPVRLRSLIHDERVTDVLCIPALYREILRHGARGLESLKRVIVAGEPCPPPLVALHCQTLPHVAMFNEYGPTEATVWATVHRCSSDDSQRETVPIGRPIANAAAYVLDSHLQPLPVGVAGELFLAGEGLAVGYHARDALTGERFVTGDLPVIGQTRLYRTGDRARWRSDWALEFLGRRDDQLKLRGYRVEPAEIESVLEQHPGVERAVVVPAMDRGGSNADDLVDLVALTPETVLDRHLADVEALSPDAVRSALQSEALDGGTESRAATADRIVARDRFRLELQTVPGFVSPPRRAQRDWFLGRAMEEFADDLEHLDTAAGTFVRGHDHHLDTDLRDISQAALTDQEIMEDWQRPLMRAMAQHVTEAHGDVLEVGFGRGVSAEFIQQFGVASHTVVEPNDHSVRHYFEPWRTKHSPRDIRLFHARWQDVNDQLGLFDGVFFHAFPMNEREFADHVLKSVTFAEHAFAAMASHLRDGGVFTYLTTEIDSLGRGHQRSLLRHFRSISMHVEPLKIPEDTRDTWWANSMVVVKAVK